MKSSLPPLVILMAVLCVGLFAFAINRRALGGELRVMSFNIRYGTAKDGDNHWDKRKAFVAETISAFMPDLLGTQETLAFQKKYLDEQLPDYSSIGVGREDGRDGGEMTAIFFRTQRFEKLDEGHFWLSETPDEPGSKSWDSSLPRMCSWVKLRERNGGTSPILFLNTHFDHRGSEARIQSARLLRRKAGELGSGCEVVIAGDFNATVNSEPYQALFAKPSPEARQLELIDTYQAAPPDTKFGEATFSGFRSGVLKGGRIDWIAASSGWEIVRASIDRTQRDGRTPSDHYPVTATLQRRSKSD